MKGWGLKRVDELGQVITGKTPSSDYPEEFGIDYPFITPSDIPSTQKYISVERFLSEKGMESHKRILLPKKATCVVCIGATIGKVCTTIIPSFSNQQINAIIANKNNNHDFVYYLASTLRDALVAFAGGAATPIVNKSAFSSIKVLVPENKIQRKIAAVLSAYDDLIENNNRRIAILEKMAEELYREWFVRLRFPGHEKVKIVKGVPEGWEVKRIGEICSELRKPAKKKSIENSILYIGLEHIPQNACLISNVGLASDIQSDKLLFNCENILFGKIRPYLHKVSIAHFSGICSTDIIVLKAKYNLLGFLYYTVRSNSFIELATTASKGTKMPRADWDFLAKQELKIPNIDLLNQFERIFTGHYKAMVNLELINVQLKQSRDRLLSRLMSGRIDVEHLDIRFPASMKEEEAINA
jgi:type I restriction enzyme S subunit